MYFPSKKDGLYFSVIWGTIVAIFLMTILGDVNLFTLVLGWILIAFLVWVWFGTGYRIEDDAVMVHCGPFRRKVDIQQIREISKEKSVLSAPALSTKRLGVRYGPYDGILVSPKREDQFIEALVHKNPNIQVAEELR